MYFTRRWFVDVAPDNIIYIYHVSLGSVGHMDLYYKFIVVQVSYSNPAEQPRAVSVAEKLLLKIIKETLGFNVSHFLIKDTDQTTVTMIADINGLHGFLAKRENVALAYDLLEKTQWEEDMARTIYMADNTEFLMEMGFIPASHRQPGLTCSCCSAA